MITEAVKRGADWIPQPSSSTDTKAFLSVNQEDWLPLARMIKVIVLNTRYTVGAHWELRPQIFSGAVLKWNYRQA